VASTGLVITWTVLLSAWAALVVYAVQAERRSKREELGAGSTSPEAELV
jgi:hypothetical protein